MKARLLSINDPKNRILYYQVVILVVQLQQLNGKIKKLDEMKVAHVEAGKNIKNAVE